MSGSHTNSFMRDASRFFAEILLTVAGFAATATGETVSLSQAQTAVSNWLKLSPALNGAVGGNVTGGRTCTVAGTSFHVVKLDNGFVVTSADTGLEPVIAFSDGGDLIENPDNPLWTFLCRDLGGRLPEAGTHNALASDPASSNASKWARLLAGSSARADRRGNSEPSSTGLENSPSDLRVAPLIKSKWGQDKNTIFKTGGELCYNYYTPYNYDCGCVATALAQILRYHRYPASVTPATRKCAVESKTSYEEKNFTMQGGEYDYENMPLIPEADPDCEFYDGGATEEQRKAIGKLTYDCGVAVQTAWAWDGSSAGEAAVHIPLKTIFRYKNAKTSTYTAGLGNAAYCAKIIYPNLDAGYPVLFGTMDHVIIADGYGYSGGTLYTHINLGWNGYDDAWYNLPTISGTQSHYSSSTIESIVYNIFPDKTGEIVSGRVLTTAGTPAANVTVSIRKTTGDGTTDFTATDAHGIFAFVVPGGQDYTITASTESASVQITARTGTSVDSDVSPDVGWYWYDDTPVSCGNVQCGDLKLVAFPPAATPVITPAVRTFSPSVTVRISCATADSVIHFTLDGSDPTEQSPVYSAPITLSETTTIKAAAFKSGMTPSAITSVTFTHTSEVVTPFRKTIPTDYDGDGCCDLSVYDPKKANWFNIAFGTAQYGWASTIPVPADYDGDGITDFAAYDQSDGAWYILYSADNRYFIPHWGWTGALPIPADYDGDGCADICVFDTATAIWYIHGTRDGDRVEQFGWRGVVPVPADYDGDGRIDLAIYSPHKKTGNPGVWYILRSSDGGTTIYQWGWDGAIPTPADFDGDGLADIGVFNRLDGFWYIHRSSIGGDDCWVPQYGWKTATPVPADYDGDGIDDLGIYDLTTGIWYTFGTTEGHRERQYGWKGAVPLNPIYWIHRWFGL